MSIEIINLIKANRERLDISFTDTAIALVLATYADKNGRNVFPGQKRLTRETGASESTIRRSCRRLQQTEILVLEEKHSKKDHLANKYCFNMSLFLQPKDKRQVSQRQEVKQRGAGVTETGGLLSQRQEAGVRKNAQQLLEQSLKQSLYLPEKDFTAPTTVVANKNLSLREKNFLPFEFSSENSLIHSFSEGDVSTSTPISEQLVVDERGVEEENNLTLKESVFVRSTEVVFEEKKGGREESLPGTFRAAPPFEGDNKNFDNLQKQGLFQRNEGECYKDIGNGVKNAVEPKRNDLKDTSRAKRPAKNKTSKFLIDPNMKLTDELRKIALDLRVNEKGLIEGMIDSIFDSFKGYFVEKEEKRPGWTRSWKEWCKNLIVWDKEGTRSMVDPARTLEIKDEVPSVMLPPEFETFLSKRCNRFIKREYFLNVIVERKEEDILLKCSNQSSYDEIYFHREDLSDLFGKTVHVQENYI